MKSLLLKFPFKGLLQKTLFLPNSPLYQRQLHSRLQRDQRSARWDQHSAGWDHTVPDETSAALDETSAVPDETSAAWDGTSAAPDGLMGSRRHFASMNPTLVAGFRSQQTTCLGTNTGTRTRCNETVSEAFYSLVCTDETPRFSPLWERWWHGMTALCQRG